MPFTANQLAQQLNDPRLVQWADSTPGNQGPSVPPFTVYFHGIQTWITAHGGANPFGWKNVTGLTRTDGTQVVLHGPQQTAPFNDAFDDVRTHLGTQGFRLFQAAEAMQRLIKVLGHLN
jgi:hypothetical protein